MEPSIFRLHLKKPDGRSLWLYGRTPISGIRQAPCPNREPVIGHSQLRWHPLRGEWVAYASHRQNRTFLPPKEFNPLLPSDSQEVPTELPLGDYDVAVFDNLFPTLALQGEFHSGAQNEQNAYGKCEVVVFSKDPGGSLAELPLEQVELILQIWAERTQAIANDPKIKYVMPFENRGIEMGVTLHHPHGQIYSYPFVPPVAEKMGIEQRRYFEEHAGQCLLAAMVEEELKNPIRVVFESPTVVAFVPKCARYPYEVWVLPKKPVALLADLTHQERVDLALTLKTVLQKYDRLWDKPMPYLMVVHQAPVNCGEQPWSHLHIELTPPLRTRDRLKYLAGTELGAGLFANDCIPEDVAKQLAAITVTPGSKP